MTFADIQMLRAGNSYILKELAILNANKVLSHYIFKSPYSYKNLTKKDRQHLNWLQRHHSSITWEQGNHEYSEVKKILNKELKNSSRIYVKGHEKKNFFIQNGYNAINVEDLGCLFNIKNLQQGYTCGQHHGVCAVRNVNHLAYWYNTTINSD